MPVLLSRLSFSLIAAVLLLLGGVILNIVEPASAVHARILPSSAANMPVQASDDDENDVSLEDLGRVKRGKKNVLVIAQAGGEGLVCQLKLKYADGNTDSPDDVISDKHGTCTMYFDVPKRKAIVGDAIAKLRIETGKGKYKGKTSRVFNVR
jgi:hypothetical protein